MTSCPPNSTSCIPLSAPHLRGNELRYLEECVDTEWVSSAGRFVAGFEKGFAEYVGARYAVATTNGTAALHIALLLAGVRPGDLVLVPTLTFVAPVNAVAYCGGAPFFFDADEYYNLDTCQVAQFLESECESGSDGVIRRKDKRRVAAALAVHVFGNAANLEPLIQICEKLQLPVVEDAAESVGTRYLSTTGGRVAGRHAGTVGHIGCYSFNGNKIITAGGGGMLTTDDEAIAHRAKYLTTQAKKDELRFIHEEIGYNYRLSNVHAAIGLAQLEKADEYKRRKQQIYKIYRESLDGSFGLRIAPLPSYASNNCWMPVLQIDADVYGEDREELMQRLARAGIQTRPVWELNHRQRPFRYCDRTSTDRAERLQANSLNLPCSVGLTDEQQNKVIAELRRGR
jgi:aminotransferase in exopolysaccharide biosynthesis